MSANKEKYINSKNKIIHCPKCRGVVLKHYKLNGYSAKMEMAIKCPHCREALEVHFEDSRVVIKNQNQK
ncbi:MAG: hypothetical protein A3G51_03385 [Candidatus Yanofskybacteria bacterium RIFCSPLOWO2_12_FULL_43_11b]|uniref:Mu-like prophage protein Com n=2 Tax=Parcubacteria group TaxID=1794811 RepID=A0A1G2RPN8_9BACT|nr:MAG: hypothetical protein A2742_02045 [Candidatus Yanofskybacteria bacterium RIFCSPHIGHO2_01_FULL_43_32]OGN34404.1 MAG: hypothetical protein A3G51_03385 [Candidatus Yanofskybacteria bacterium RIFCSPLOWO2_12_FULL_43_11b]OHA74830.1 MAG: hypothetical protein A3A32_03185 [Candidatus Wildermuthbacteria bacterium RIFCSPLOWO2_01_FULL_48_35]